MPALVGQHFYHDVLVVNLALRIVGLKRERSGRQFSPVGGYGGFVEGFAVDLDGNLVAVHDNVLREPFIVFRRWFPDILDTIDATGPAPVCMTVVYLYLVTLLRPTGVLILRVNVHARVGSRLRHDLRLVFKV